MISVVIPNFNSGEKLVENLPKLLELLKKSKLEYEATVVDDASTDDSVAKIKSLGLKIKIIKKRKNTGFGMTVDKGVRTARGEIVFVLNAIDILPELADYFRIMLAHFKDPKVFSVAALKRDEEDHGCGRIYFEKGFFLHGKRDPSTALGITAWADGGSQALRREYYLKIGGFDPLYKFYWEDVDLGYRAWKAGYQVDFEDRALLLHQKSEGPIAEYYSQEQRQVMNWRNQFIFVWKNADGKHLLLYFLWETYHFAVALKNQNWVFFRAYWQAFCKWPEILMVRIRQRKFSTLSDDEVVNSFFLGRAAR